jgi:hypothetical protein
MKKTFALTAMLIALSKSTFVYGQSLEPFSQFQIDASLPLQFNTNSLITTTNSQSDFFASPFLKLSTLGNLSPTLSYSIYASTAPDAYARVKAADDAAAIVGGKIVKAICDYKIGAIYEHSLTYDGVFRSLLFQADDFSGFVGYAHKNAAGFTFAPSAMTTYRAADLASAERVVVTVKAEMQQDLTKSLSAFLTPKIRYYGYTAGTASGRRDTYPSLLGGLTYAADKDWGVTASVEYDQRWSNVLSANFTNTIFLLSLDFTHTYNR